MNILLNLKNCLKLLIIYILFMNIVMGFNLNYLIIIKIIINKFYIFQKKGTLEDYMNLRG
jgi:hypothetical protein